MKLLELYSLATGLKIDEPFIYKAFYPLPFQKYVTLHASSSTDAKCYSFWEDVVTIIKPVLDKLDIHIVQIGGKEDERLKGCFHLTGVVSMAQTAYILSNSLFHMSNDTFSAHVAGHSKIPQVCIYGATTFKNHGPLVYHEDSVFLESDRKGKLPSYSNQESPKTVDFIFPETIANAILKRFDASTKRKSLYFGEFYPVHIVEQIPDFVMAPDKLANGIINIRMDYLFNEDILAQTLYTRKCNILASQPINLKILRGLKQNINKISYDVMDDRDIEYIKAAKQAGVSLDLQTKEKDPEKLANLRLKFFDFEITQETSRTKQELDMADKLGDNTYFKTNKFILSKDGIFLSKADWKAKRPIKGFDDNIQTITDTESFWEEADHFYIFNQ